MKSKLTSFCLSIRIDEIFKLIIFLKLLFGDEIVKLRESDRNVLGDISEPRNFAFRGLNISSRDKTTFKSSFNLREFNDTWMGLNRKR